MRNFTRSLVVAAAGLLSLTGVASADRALSVQEAILRAKPAVALVVAEVSANVRLNCGSGETRVTPPPFRETGTGWVIDARGFLITNGHVVQPAYNPPRWLLSSLTRKAAESTCLPAMLAQRGIAPDARPDLEEQLRRRIFETVVPAAQIKIEPAVYVVLSNGLRLSAELKKYSPPVAGAEMSGRDLALLKINANDLPVLVLGDSKKGQIGDPVHILGFPGVVLSHELLNQTASREASVTSGAISGFKQDVANNPVIQTDAPAAWGNSGGPAVDAHGDVIGVLTFVSLAPGGEGNIVQGFNFIIPAAAVRDFAQGTEVRLDGQSKFNEAWWSGLRAFFHESYRTATKHFEAANQIQPNLPDVKRILAEARERPTPIPWAWLAAGVTVVSLGGYGVMLGMRWKRNRFRIPPAEVVRLLEQSPEPPILLDVRSANTYAKSPLRIANAVHVTPEELDAGATPVKIEPDRTVVAYCT